MPWVCDIKFVIFQPLEDRYSTDVYLNSERIHCGGGYDSVMDGFANAKSQILALSEDRLWTTTQYFPPYICRGQVEIKVQIRKVVEKTVGSDSEKIRYVGSILLDGQKFGPYTVQDTKKVCLMKLIGWLSVLGKKEILREMAK